MPRSGLGPPQSRALGRRWRLMAHRVLITGGAIISVDESIGELRRGDLLFEDGKILHVARSIAADAELVDATDMIVMPGLVEAHRHLWQTGTRADMLDGVLDDLVSSQWPAVASHLSPEDVYACVLAGAAEALSGGVTTLLDWCHVANTPAHAEENLRALRDVGIRGRFMYGASMTRKLDEYAGSVAHPDSWEHAEVMLEREFTGTDGLLSFGLALQGLDTSTLDLTKADIAVARRLSVPMGFHVGVPQGAPPRRSIERLAQAGLLGPDMTFAHCCDASDDELRLLADAGSTAAACPSIDLALGLGVPAHGRLRAAGLDPAVCVDSVIASTGDLFAEMRVSLLAERQRRAAAIFAAGRPVSSQAELRYSSRDALNAVTIHGARTIWLDDQVGSLSPGKRADIVLLRASDLNLIPPNDLVATVVGAAHAGNVDTVFVNGRKLKAAGRLLHLDEAPVRAGLMEARDRMFAYAGYQGLRPPS